MTALVKRFPKAIHAQGQREYWKFIGEELVGRTAGILGLGNIGGMIFQTTNNTVIQSSIPAELRGRVMSVMMMSFGLIRTPGSSYPPAVTDARDRILDVARQNNVIFSEVGTNAGNVIERVDDGIMFHFANEEAARIGREHTDRVMPY